MACAGQLLPGLVRQIFPLTQAPVQCQQQVPDGQHVVPLLPQPQWTNVQLEEASGLTLDDP